MVTLRRGKIAFSSRLVIAVSAMSRRRDAAAAGAWRPHPSRRIGASRHRLPEGQQRVLEAFAGAIEGRCEHHAGLVQPP
jgi:hypothetical protein